MRLPTTPASRSLAAAAAVVAIVGGGLAVRHGEEKAPVAPDAAGLDGQVWVMPAAKVGPFLSSHGVKGVPTRAQPGTEVVGRVSWTPRPTSAEERYTLLLGDTRGGAGNIHDVLDVSADQASLGSGSMWNRTVESTSWLRGNRPLHLGEGYTDFATFATVSTSVSGDVWFVADVLDVTAVREGTLPPISDDPRPVLEVALTTGDRVWWHKRVASAEG